MNTTTTLYTAATTTNEAVIVVPLVLTFLFVMAVIVAIGCAMPASSQEAGYLDW